jgi:hypothetical protein
MSIAAVMVIAIIGSPFVYAAVEPHIILVMDSAQTTAPFTIQDNGGTDLFSISSDGYKTVEGGNDYYLRYVTSDTVSVATGDIEDTDPQVLDAIGFAGHVTETGDQGMTYYEIRFDGERIQDTGVGNVVFAFEGSADDITWYQIASCQTSTSSWTVCDTGYVEGYQGLTGWIYNRIVVYNDDGATTGRFADINAQMKITVPAGWTVNSGWTG